MSPARDKDVSLLGQLPLLVFFDKLIAAGMSHIFLKTLQKAYNAREGIQLL